MTDTQHIMKRATFKGALIVINLVFLTTQFSYKFYVCSSVPVFTLAGTAISGIPHLRWHTDAHGFADGKLMSMDKRYNSEHTFALLTPVTTFRIPTLARTTLISRYQGHLFIPAVLIPLQRGPPII